MRFESSKYIQNLMIHALLNKKVAVRIAISLPHYVTIYERFFISKPIYGVCILQCHAIIIRNLSFSHLLTYPGYTIHHQYIHSTPTFCWQSVTCGFLKYISFYLHWDFVWIFPRRPIWLNSTLAWHPSGNVSLSEPLSCTKPSICQWVVLQWLHVSAMLSQNINEVIMAWFDKHN